MHGKASRTIVEAKDRVDRIEASRVRVSVNERRDRPTSGDGCQSEIVLGGGWIWSSGLIVGRTAIGLGHLWLSRKAAIRSGQASNGLCEEHRMTEKPHLIVIGNGMAGCRAVEEILARDADGYRITIFGAEPRVNYNRIMLSPLLAGEKSFDDIVINDQAWYDDNWPRRQGCPGPKPWAWYSRTWHTHLEGRLVESRETCRPSR